MRQPARATDARTVPMSDIPIVAEIYSRAGAVADRPGGTRSL